MSARRTILTAALIVGALDFAYASLMTAFRGGSITKLWQFVGSGVLGPDAFTMGAAGAVVGVVCHFLIMGVFAAAIYAVAAKVPLITKQAVLSGLIYGIGIWIVMNLLVVPLSRTGAKAPTLEPAAILNWGFAMHLVIGLALVFITKRGLRARA